MWSSKRTIAAGDTVIVWMTRDNLEPMVITPSAVLHNKFGVFPHDSLIGLPYGSKVRSSAPSNSGRRGESNSGGGFLYVLRPTPELWTLALPHRTQILYIADISFVIAHLNIGPGKRVVEAGTGSGSFSHSVARSVGSKGQLYTFEFHEQRAEKAKAEFEKHGLSPGVVTLEHRNVCKDGFGEGLEEREEVDAVFLDLPAPWEAVGHAKRVMRKDRVSRICCFSPCIEQVIRTVTALNDAGFSEITMFETLLRPIDVSSTPRLPSIGEATERLKAAEVKREEKRRRQIAQNREREAKEKASASASAGAPDAKGEKESEKEHVPSHGEKRKQEDDDDGEADNEWVDVKRAKTSEDASSSMQIDDESSLSYPAIPVISTSELPLSHLASASAPTPTPSSTTQQKISVSKALPEVRGHTSYLTFATLVPYAYAQRTKEGGAVGSAAKEQDKKGGKESKESDTKTRETIPAATEASASGEAEEKAEEEGASA